MEPEGLTAEELRKQLFVSFRSTGILGSIKEVRNRAELPKVSLNTCLLDGQSQLRAALLQQLRNQDETLFDSSGKGRPSLQDRLLNSMFLEYLDASDFPFTQSVFLPESQMDCWPPFSHDEMVQILRLDLAPLPLPDDKASKKTCCLAQQLVTVVQHLLGSVKTQDSSTQTEEFSAKKLDGWLKEIDDNFLRKMELEKRNPAHTLEERINRYYQDFDNRVRAEVDAQVTKIREFELGQVRMEEAANYRRQLAIAQKDLGDMQKTRFEHLSQHDDSFMERMLAKQKEVEFLAYQQRQKVLEDKEELRAREEKLTLQAQMQENSLQQREERVRAKETQLKIQEEDINHLREFLHCQADEILAMKKNQLEKEYESLHQKLSLDRSILEAEQLQLKEEKKAFAAEASSARSDKELVQALYRRLSTEEAQKKTLLVKINELEEKLKMQLDEASRTMTIYSRERNLQLESSNPVLSKEFKPESVGDFDKNLYELQIQALRARLQAKGDELEEYKQERLQWFSQDKMLERA